MREGCVRAQRESDKSMRERVCVVVGRERLMIGEEEPLVSYATISQHVCVQLCFRLPCWYFYKYMNVCTMPLIKVSRSSNV